MCLALLTLLRATLSGGPTRGSLLGLRGWEVELRLGVPNLGCPATEAAGWTSISLPWQPSLSAC
jgi:hypothetical protein